VELATPIRLEEEEGMRYWLGLQNFYVITRYNHSAMYAMAVWELSQTIAAARAGS
jgi:membrane-bound lytic murein transglycosylase B